MSKGWRPECNRSDRLELRNYACQAWIEETIEHGKLAVLLMAAFGFGGIQSQKENAISFFSSKSQIPKFQDLQTDHSAT